MPDGNAHEPHDWTDLVEEVVGYPTRGSVSRRFPPPGSVVPVLGPFAASRRFDLPFGVHDFQTEQRKQCGALYRSLQASASPQCARYLSRLPDAFMGELDDTPTLLAPTVAPEDMTGFVVAIVELAVALTEELGAKLSSEPEPIHRAEGIRHEQDSELADRLAAVLQAGTALQQWIDAEQPSWAPVLDLTAVRARLVRLVAIWLGEGEITGEPELREALEKAGYGALVRTYGLVTGIDAQNPPQRGGWARVCLSGRDSGGLTWDHCGWLDELVRHCVVSQTSAHRTQRELAFALSLFDRSVIDLVEPPTSPSLERLHFHEVAVAWAGRSIQPAPLTLLLRRAEEAGAACSSELPHVFHQAIANLLAVEADHAAESSVPNPAVAICAGFDRTLERALACRLGPERTFVLLLPLEQPLRDAGSEAMWLVCECRSSADPSGYDLTPVETVTGSKAIQMDLKGVPVVVKLAGSPLEGERIGDRTQRLVLDEYDLLTHYVGKGTGLPEPLAGRLAVGRLYFLGMERGTLADRAHFYAVDTAVLRRDGGGRGAVGVAATGDRDLSSMAIHRRANVAGAVLPSLAQLIAQRGAGLTIEDVRDRYRRLSEQFNTEFDL